ncbi:MAG: hypothetical protein ABSB63_14685 [Spirochaetia bacterium]|jgi:hypothetical protein
METKHIADFSALLKNKQDKRAKNASLPVSEKVRIMDRLHERDMHLAEIRMKAVKR